MPLRVSFLFGLTTSPESASVASARSAGWSEGLWLQSDSNMLDKIKRLAPLRARMLPSQAAIIGWRTQSYTISGSKLIPGGANSVKQRFAGNSGFNCDVPQMAFRISLPTQNAINKATLTLRGIPDTQVVNGEASPTGAFSQSIVNFENQLNADGWGTVGRNLSAASQSVLSIVGNILTTTIAIPGVNENSTYLRLVKVKDLLGRPVIGSFLVTAINGKAYTLANWTHPSNTGLSGTARIDALTFLPIADVDFPSVLAVVKKVGRPFVGYRGRGSRRKVAV